MSIVDGYATVSADLDKQFFELRLNFTGFCQRGKHAKQGNQVVEVTRQERYHFCGSVVKSESYSKSKDGEVALFLCHAHRLRASSFSLTFTQQM
mmetsp:Transcript_74939/g.124938  ORF Transcript_74939/g.124938 Transcript_74939/m.124938 type:complete len:94 (-) Transcript_74939:401-682(-)